MKKFAKLDALEEGEGTDHLPGQGAHSEGPSGL